MTLRVRGISIAAALAVALAGFPASAATVSNKAGTVLISDGEGFVPITGDAELAPGARVVVKAGGLATITYAANCTVRVGSGFWTVQESAPCAKGATEIDFTQRMNQQGPPSSIFPDQIYPDHLLLGAAVVGGVVACVVWWCRDHDRPASP